MAREIGKALLALTGFLAYAVVAWLLAACDFARGGNATP